MTDAELVARSKHDVDAFGLLVERHQRLVFGVALARCQDPDLAADLAQEAFVAAWRDLPRLRDTSRVGPWVAGIARNLAANASRQRARQPDPPLPDTPPTPEDEALAREDRELLQHALADIPAAHRETLVLYYLEGESISAIAEALGVREDLVKQRLSRGRRALRDSITTRVESALARTRSRPLRAGVLAAIATTTHETAAHAGKVLAIMSTKKLLIATTATVAVAGGAVWLGVRASADRPSSSVPATTATSPATAAGTPTAAAAGNAAPPTVKRIASPAARETLLTAIRSARQRRTSAAGSPPTSTTSGAAPSLAAETDYDKEYIRGAMQALIPLLTDCYTQALERDKTLQGRLVVDFTIEGEPGVGGVVTESSVDTSKSDLVETGMRECVQETMFALEIDPPTGGGVVKVSYPFEFAPE